MASKARHLHSGFNQQSISIDKLFSAAFGPSPAHYRHQSLMGWRPVTCQQMPHTDIAETRRPIPKNMPRPNPPGIQIHESAERILVEVELPAIKAESLYLEIAGDLLIIRGERIMEQRPGSRRATRTPLVHRYVQLPIIARPGEVRARLEGNIVKVNISKRPKLD